MAEASDRQRELIDAALRIYRPAMRRYITDTLNEALGDDWYEEWLKERIDGGFLPDHVRDRYVDNLEAVQRGDRDPRDALGPSEFPYVFGDRREHFPPDLAPLIDAMHEVLRDRTIQPDLSDTDAQQQAQRLLENCRAVLRPVDEKAARRIQRLLDTEDPDSVRDEPGTAPNPRRSNARRERATREAAEQRGGHPRPDTPPNTASATGASRPAESDDGIPLPLPDPKNALERVLGIYREQMREYFIPGEFQSHGVHDWLVKRVAEKAPKHIKSRLRDSYEKDKEPAHKIIDVDNFEPIIRNNPDVFGELSKDHSILRRMVEISEVRNAFPAHHRKTPFSPDVEDLADNCAFVLRACHRTAAANEVIRISRAGQGAERPGPASPPAEVADGSPPAPERPSTQDDLELDELRQTDLETYRWRMRWFLKETPDEWHRHMDRLRNHDVAAWAVELLGQGEQDGKARNEETDRIATLSRAERRKAMKAIWALDESAWHRALHRWDRRPDHRPWREEMTALLDRDPSAWRTAMDGRRRRDNARWHADMDALWRWDSEACKGEWIALRQRDSSAYRKEMTALQTRSPDAHYALESAELAEIGDDIVAQRAWFDDDPQRQERHQDDYTRLLEVELHKLIGEEQRELDDLSYDWDAQRNWFDADPQRIERHPHAFAELERAEDERAELARRQDDLPAQRAWFADDPQRQERHHDDYTRLLEAEALVTKQLEDERAELAELGDDWPELRRWFTANPGGRERHPAKYDQLRAAEAAEERRRQLLGQEQRDLAGMEHDWDAQRGWFDADPPRQERHPEAFDELLLAEGEREQLAERAGNLPAQREWFGAVPERQQRHADDYAALEEAEAAKRLEDERAELAGIKGNAVAQRKWFDAVPERQQRHADDYAALEEAELIERERPELAALGDDWFKLQRWFAAKDGRPGRHPERFEALQAELARQHARKRELDQGQRDLARMEHDWDAQRGWFDADPPRQERHPEAFNELLLAEGEREQLAERAGNLPAQHEWFDAVPERQQRHVAAYSALREAELSERERLELDELGDDWSELQRWFAADAGRPKRHPERSKELREELARQRELERERRELVKRGNNWTAKRNWFDADPSRQERHPEALDELLLAEDEREHLAERAGNLPAQREWFDAVPERRQRHAGDYATLEEAELIERERPELAALGDDWFKLQRWFAAKDGRPGRHPERFEALQAELARQHARKRELDQGQRDLARMEHDWAAQRNWFDADPLRQARHPEAFDELQRAEKERAELAELERESSARRAGLLGFLDRLPGRRDGWLSAQRKWFEENPARRRRHRDLYEPVLHAVEAEQLIERERHELADLSHEWSQIGRWFADESGRIERHPKAYRALQRAERDLAQLASLGGDVSARRRWFYRDPRRRFRYPQQWAESKRDAKALREQEREERRREREARALQDEAAGQGSVGEGSDGAAAFQPVVPLPYANAGEGSDAATQEGWDGGGGVLPTPEDEAQRGGAPIRRLVRRIVLVLVAAVVIAATGYAVYELIASSGADTETEDSSETTSVAPQPQTGGTETEPGGGSGTSGGETTVLAPVIDRLTCEPERPEVGETVTCGASISGGEPDSWSWSGGGDPPSGSGDTFMTTFGSAGDREISLTVENITDRDSRSFAIEVVSAPTLTGGRASLSSGAGHSCRLTNDGAAACWGSDKLDRLNVPDGRFTAISAGSAHTCGLRESGAVVCWGWSGYDQLTWPPDKKFVSISAGHRHTCGITEQQDVVCWGSDSYGQDADRDGQFSQVSAGYFHNCAITTSGEVECWGTYNEQGQTEPPPGRFATVSAGQDHTCGLRHGGGVECWGGGEAGESPEGSFTAISAGQFHNCGILTSGTVRCWGDGSEGQLVDVPAGDGFAQIDAGAEHACAARTNGEIVCWGNTANGLDDVGSAAIGDHTWQGSDPQPRPAQCNLTAAEGECREPPRPECDFIDDEGKCVEPPRPECDFIDDEGNCLTDGDDDLEGDAMDDDAMSDYGFDAEPEEIEPRTTSVTASDSHQAEPPGDGTIDPEGDAMEDDDGSGLQPGALQEEEPGTTIVIAEDNPIIVIPAQESADGDVMEDDE